MWVTEFWGKNISNVKFIFLLLSLLYSEYIEYLRVHSYELRVVADCFIQQILIEHSASIEMNDIWGKW